MRNVLIISGTGDAHAEHMCHVMDKVGIEHFLFLTDQYPFNTQLTFDFSRDYVLEYNKKQIVLDSNLAIWNRRIFDPEFPESFPKNLEDMVKKETRSTIYGLMIMHEGVVVNNPNNNNLANNKLGQLKRAMGVGLIVPETIITNSPEETLNFYEKHNKDIIFKMQKMPIIKESNGLAQTIMTNRVLPEHLINVNRIKNSPCFFQERVDKEYEIRLTIIGDKLFPIAIYSQNSEYSKDDFRRYDFEKVSYNLVEIPDEVASKIFKLVNGYGLRYATIDLVRTPKGEYIFLEINPNGQYLWSEERSGVPITDTFAGYLAGIL